MLVFFLLLLFVLTGKGLVFKSTNSRQVLEEQLVGQPLRFDLLFADDNELNHVMHAHWKTCFLINGGVCHCFPESITTVTMIFPSSCRINKDSYWFSIAILDNNDKPVLSSTPLFITNQTSTVTKENLNLLTLVLPLTLDDVSRAALLFNSLTDHIINHHTVLELLVITPDNQVNIIRKSLQGFMNELMFPVRVISENILFHRPKSHWKQHPYATQMAIKLLVAQIVQTNAYLTLDADLLLHHRLELSKLMEWRGKEDGDVDWLPVRLLYHHEASDVHSNWWEGSKQLLQVNISNTIQGFGVTPALLSTWGSLLTIATLRQAIRNTQLPQIPLLFPLTTNSPSPQIDPLLVYAPADHIPVSELHIIEAYWLESLGQPAVWSEYTLYRSVLDVYKVFEEVHIREESHGIFLHCHNVWFVEQLPWSSDLAFRNTSCLFSVVQSTTGIASNILLQQYQDSSI